MNVAASCVTFAFTTIYQTKIKNKIIYIKLPFLLNCITLLFISFLMTTDKASAQNNATENGGKKP